MRVFLISNMYPDENSPGYGSFVKNVVDGLESQGIMFPFKAVIKGRSQGIGAKIRTYIRFYLSILNKYFKDYDFIYIHFPNQALPLLVPLYFIKKKRIVINLHGEDLLYENKGIWKYLGRLNDWFMKRVCAIVVPSDFFKGEVLKRTGHQARKIIISPSGGINSEIFHPCKKTENTGKIPIIGYVGRIEDGKGWKEYVEVMKELSHRDIKCEGLIIGYGSQQDELKKILTDYALSNITYIERLPQKELPTYYSRLLLLLFSSRKAESLGLVGIEAMACGVPVVSGNKYGVSSYLENGKNGYFIENGDIQGTVECIKKYMEMPLEYKKRIVENCLETAQRYERNHVINELAHNLEQIIS